MKYIRTKDNIYEIVNDYGSSCAIKSKGKRGRTAIDGFTIKYGLSYAPRADTIEELCDYIVYNEYAENSNGKLIFKKISADWVKEQLKNVMLDGGGNIKLAILTDKGLIYVAKMNEKGELELL